MGLDMYLYKSKKVEGWTAKDYRKVENLTYEMDKKIDIKTLENAIKYLKEITYLPNLEQIDLKVKNNKCYLFLEQVGYWRKANAIHRWFVKNIQDGMDECDYFFVTKEHLENLMTDCDKVLNNILECKNVLPTQDGFFFGSSDYDLYYIENIKSTYELCSKLLKQIDFNHEVLLYQSSW
jgi:hypothetical protein